MEEKQHMGEKWEYLTLLITGHNKALYEAQNMLVTTSDGRWRATKMPNDPMAIVNQLGKEGWELVNYSGWSEFRTIGPWAQFDAIFKRRLTS